jgi:hypothetical protein
MQVIVICCGCNLEQINPSTSPAQMTDYVIRILHSDHRHIVCLVHGVAPFPSLCYWSEYIIIAWIRSSGC